MSTGARALFVAGAGTGIGKTYVTAALTRWLRENGRSVAALKPVASGMPPLDDPTFAQSDTAILLAAQGLPVTAETVAAISPWRFEAPLAPDIAAAREGRRLDLGELVAWCRARMSDPDELRRGAGPLSRLGEEARSLLPPVVLVEGVGGLMSPVTEEATGLDWLEALAIPTLLVSGSYLGAISHALTALETLAAHRVPAAAVIVSESEDAPGPPSIVVEAIARRVRVPVAALHRGSGWPQELAGLFASVHTTSD